MKHLRFILSLVIICCQWSVILAQTSEAEVDIRAGVVVCEEGDVLYSTIGHAALHMQCEAYGLDYVYSYEGEDAAHQVWTFLRGKLNMGMFAIPMEMFAEGYRQEGREVTEYPLNLTQEQKKALWRVLDERVAQGSDLPYDYFQRGCAITIVEILHEALGDTPIDYTPWTDKYTGLTRRELVEQAIVDHSWQEYILYMLIGAVGDKAFEPEDKLIVPTDLAEVWQQASIDGHPLLGTPKMLLESRTQPHRDLFTPLMLMSILLLLFAAGQVLRRLCRTRAAQVVSSIATTAIIGLSGIMGLVMTWLVGFSDLPCTQWNWLLVPFNILPLIGWHWRHYWAKPYAAVITIWSAAMLLWPHTLVDPSQVMLAMLFAGALLLENHESH